MIEFLWTVEEYEKFIDTYGEDDIMHRVLFELLFWTGMRIGEVLALIKNDIDINRRVIKIAKTFHRMKGEDIITTPKTKSSKRTINIPAFLADELKEYFDKLYEYPDDERLFPFVQEAVQHNMKRHIEKAGVKKIRVHDLRHSHAAYLIHEGTDALLVKKRLGHLDIKITLNTYGHLYPDDQKKVAEMLDRNRTKKE